MTESNLITIMANLAATFKGDRIPEGFVLSFSTKAAREMASAFMTQRRLVAGPVIFSYSYEPYGEVTVAEDDGLADDEVRYSWSERLDAREGA